MLKLATVMEEEEDRYRTGSVKEKLKGGGHLTETQGRWTLNRNSREVDTQQNLKGDWD